MDVFAREVVENITSITFNFSNTDRGTPLTSSNIEGNYIITVNGDIELKSKANGSAIVTIIGGTESHIHRKDKEENAQYYMNSAQKAAMHQILLALATTGKFNASIGSGNNEDLNIVAESIFENYRA